MTPEEIKELHVGEIVFDPKTYPYVLCLVVDTPETLKEKYVNVPDLYVTDGLDQNTFMFKRLADGTIHADNLRNYETWDKIPD